MLQESRSPFKLDAFKLRHRLRYFPPSSDSVTVMPCSFDRVVHDQDNNGANHRDKQTIQIQARNAASAKEAEHPSSGNCADDAEHDVKKDTFPTLVDDLTANESGN
jgi:hypothetical protein